jgi:hypothetical protein
MTDPIAVDTDDATQLAAFKASALAAWAKHANTENWNGQFTATMLELGYTQAELDAARDAGKSVHTLTVTIRTDKTLAIRGGYGQSLTDTVAGEVRRGFNLGRGDSVTVEHATDVPA